VAGSAYRRDPFSKGERELSFIKNYIIMELFIIIIVIVLTIGIGILWGRRTLKKHIINKAQEIDELDQLHLMVEWNGPINFKNHNNQKYEESLKSVETTE
jgi:hypothetical protein